MASNTVSAKMKQRWRFFFIVKRAVKTGHSGHF